MAGRIVIAENALTERILLKSRVAETAHSAVAFESAADLFAGIAENPPDIVFLPDKLDDWDGPRLIRRVGALMARTRPAIVLLTSRRERAHRLEALRAGADAILPRRPDPAVMRAWIRSLMRRRAEESELQDPAVSPEIYGMAEPQLPDFGRPGQIALIAGSLAEGLSWRNGLTPQFRDRISVLDPAQALRELDGGAAPDAVVVGTGGESAMQLLSDLRSRSETHRSAILVVQPTPDPTQTVAALDHGADSIAEEGFDPEEMAHLLRRELARKARSDSRRAALRDGLRLASTDPLTGLFNRRFALKQLDCIMRGAPERGETFAVMVLDLDRFKQINDLYGHAAGDAVLIELAGRMQGCLRLGDVLARIGGEEFLAVVRRCDLAAARVAAERLRRTVAEAPVVLPDGKTRVQVTVSIGLVIGGTADQPDDAATLIDQADRGLYAAKAEGRNQVTVYRSAA